MPKEIPWSFSKLEAYELCPKKFFHTQIARDVKESFGPEADYGKEVHKHFELRLINGKRLPLDLTHHEPKLKKLADAPGESFPEQKLALNKDFQPTGFFDNDVWLRGIVDYAKKNASNLLIIDHKTGKQHDKFDQLYLMAAMLSAYMPDVENFLVAYYWTKSKELTPDKLKKEDITEVWAQFLPRVEAMQQAIRHDEFPAKKNFLCRRHCPVKSCPYNGG